MARSRQPSVLAVLLIAVLILAFVGLAAFRFTGGQATSQVRRLRQKVSRADFNGGLKGTDAEMRKQFLDLARANPNSLAEISAYAFVMDRWPGTPEANVSRNGLLKSVKTVSMDDLAQCFAEQNPGKGKEWHQLARSLMQRVQQEPNHPMVGSLLSDAAIIYDPDAHDGRVPEELLQIADLIQGQYASSPDLANFCETICNLGKPEPWMQSFEPHLREILRVNQNRFVLCSAHFALGTVVRSAGREREEEVREILEDFLVRFDGTTKYPAQSVEENLRHQAERILTELDREKSNLTDSTLRGPGDDATDRAPQD